MRAVLEWLRVAALVWLVAYVLSMPRRRRLAEQRFRRWHFETMRAAYPELELERNPYVWRWLMETGP